MRSRGEPLELIILQGHPVAPAELEAHLLAHPAVSDCAVIPVPDSKAGETPKAYIVRSQNAEQTPTGELIQELLVWVTDHKAAYKALRGGIEFVDTIPKSPSGKILRRMLKDEEASRTLKEKARI